MNMESDRNMKYSLYLVLAVLYFRICIISSCSVYENDEYERTYISRYSINLGINHESIYSFSNELFSIKSNHLSFLSI